MNQLDIDGSVNVKLFELKNFLVSTILSLLDIPLFHLFAVNVKLHRYIEVWLNMNSLFEFCFNLNTTYLIFIHQKSVMSVTSAWGVEFEKRVPRKYL